VYGGYNDHFVFIDKPFRSVMSVEECAKYYNQIAFAFQIAKKKLNDIMKFHSLWILVLKFVY